MEEQTDCRHGLNAELTFGNISELLYDVLNCRPVGKPMYYDCDFDEPIRTFCDQ